MTNDEGQKNDENRITNYGSDQVSDGSDCGEEDFWGERPDGQTNELHEEPDGKRVFDLEERTARFGEGIIQFAKKIPQNPVNNRLSAQLVGAGTSIGGNYCEADDGVSRKDFKNKIGTCKKEARETKFFLRMVATADPSLRSPDSLAGSQGVASYLLRNFSQMIA